MEAARLVIGGVDTHKDTHVVVAVDQLGRQIGASSFPSNGAGCRALVGTRSRPPQQPHVTDPVGVLDQRAAVLIDRGHDRPPAHAQLVRELGHGPGVRSDLAAASAPARMVSTARLDTCSDISVQVRAGHSGSRQRHLRFDQTSRAGRPNAGRSRMSTAMRPCASARTPQLGQPTTTAVVSIWITTSAAVSVTASTRNPSSPNSASARPVPSSTAGVSRFFVVVTSHEDRGAPAPRGGPSTTACSRPQREKCMWPRGCRLSRRHDRPRRRRLTRRRRIPSRVHAPGLARSSGAADGRWPRK